MSQEVFEGEILNGSWVVEDERTGRTVAISQPTRDELLKAKREFGYTTIKIVSLDEASHRVVIRPVDTSG